MERKRFLEESPEPGVLGTRPTLAQRSKVGRSRIRGSEGSIDVLRRRSRLRLEDESSSRRDAGDAGDGNA